jgi:ATP-dependent DNA helicase RecQ
MTQYNRRKEEFHKRMKQMIRYVKEDMQCRSRFIGLYFGDNKIKACGICDNCLKHKSTRLTKDEFDTIHHRIINMVKYEPLHTRELMLKLNGINKEKAWKVLEFLQVENKIEMDYNGKINLK